jgi:holin-like protein
MIGGLLQLLVFQGIGELLARFVVPVVPGPVLGLVALLAWLRARGGAGEGLDLVAAAFSRHLGLLFVPAAVGVVMFVPQLREHLPGLVAALVASVVATIAASAWLMKVLSPRDDGDDPAPEVDPCDAPGAPPAPAEPRR